MMDMDEVEAAKLSPQAHKRVHKATQRWRSYLLGLWMLCPKAACRRAHDCAADPDFCVDRFAGLISWSLRDAVDTLCEAKRIGRIYEEARAMDKSQKCEGA